MLLVCFTARCLAILEPKDIQKQDLKVSYYYTTVTKQEKIPRDLPHYFVIISILEVTIYVKHMRLSFSTDSGCFCD